jgi:LmbE family N-acetylglucosaminyl deacetylase
MLDVPGAVDDCVLMDGHLDKQPEFSGWSDGLEPWTVDEVWVMGHPGGVDYIDITAQIDRKIEALLCHESQHADPERTEALVREWGRSIGAAAGLPEGSAAELFRVVNTR